MAIHHITIDNKDLITGSDRTFLSSDVASGASTITVDSIARFAVNQILCVGDIGQENTEIIITSSGSAPSGYTVTLNSNTVYPHSRGTPVYIIDYNRYELSHATTTTGAKTTLTTTTPPFTLGSGLINVDPEKEFTMYPDTEYSTGYYFVRKKETIGNTFSGYSDPIPVDGWTSNTVGYAIEQALRPFGGHFTEEVTHDFLIDEANAFLKYVQGKQLHWTQYQTLKYTFGQTARGTNVFSLPSDIYDTTSNQSLSNIRIGNNENLVYQFPDDFQLRLRDTLVTQVTTQATAGQTTLAINNSYDFADSGTVNVYISGTKYSITYTGVTRSASAGVLTGVPASGTGAITVTIAASTYVWQNEWEGTPLWYTVRNGQGEFWPLAGASDDNENIYGDYWTVATEVDSDGDTIDSARFDMLILWLKWKIRNLLKNDGKLDYQDGDYTLFKEMLNDAIRTKPRGLRFKTRPAVNRMNTIPSWKIRARTSNDN